MAKLNKIKVSSLKIKQKPFSGYREITRQELKELRRMSLKEAIRQTEILLKEVIKWKK